MKNGAAKVSSRAPVWGASGGERGRKSREEVSSRAPVWGASYAPKLGAADEIVSSRAPVWGASHFLAGNVQRPYSFKSCPRVGGIPALLWVPLAEYPFQVVPPCGGHPYRSEGPGAQSTGFKSCPRVGGINILDPNTKATASFKSCPRVGGIPMQICCSGAS